ncbi:uncharacterized protein PG998_002897 [Apiospora kogelbergensis]|uniref:uncharacterized protein n=1 Tax=Apiospora kogelbergensis TaxID=1337665 RepID=UPI00313251C1
MFNLKFATFGLLATAVVSSMAYLPPHKRSESAIDLGQIEGLDHLQKLLGLPSTKWETIEEPEVHDWDAIAAEDALRASGTSPAATPENLGLARRDENASPDQCANTTGFDRLVCQTLPTRVPLWAAGGALSIWYAPPAFMRFVRAYAATIRIARSLRGEARAEDMVKRAANGEAPRQFRFSLSALPLGSNGTLAARDEDLDLTDMELSHQYVYEEATGILHYMGTRGALDVEEQVPSARRGTGPVGRRDPTRNYTIVLQATALSSASTIASTECVGDIVKWHINQATEQNRFRCAPLDNRGSWKMALHVNVNHGRGNGEEIGSCCEF